MLRRQAKLAGGVDLAVTAISSQAMDGVSWGVRRVLSAFVESAGGSTSLARGVCVVELGVGGNIAERALDAEEHP